MKILELRFKNLNSLYGEWVIDFTDPVYISNGIFAMTGPTGAGKSTILDAVCLALYGATPRLGKITKSGNEIMSRRTGECYAEVLFESQAGQFRCHWEQRRARKQPEGNLQDQEHQIIDAATGKPIETKKSLVITVIEKKTGMDFDRFTRSILLAQGGFDTFLKADIEQKSKILEQITGTEIYSEISRKVHERQRDEQEKLRILQAETSGIAILDIDRETELQESLAALQKEETGLIEKSAETYKLITWLRTIDVLKKELINLTDESAQLETEKNLFQPERIKLEQALKAASLDGVYAMLTALRTQQKDDVYSLEKQKTILPGLEMSVNAQSKILKTAEQDTLDAKEELKTAIPLLQKIRLLDQKIVEQTKAVSDRVDTYTKNAEKIEVDKQVRLNELKKQAAAQKNLKTVQLYLKENAHDEWLISGLAGIEEQCSNLLSKQEEITQKESEHTKAASAVAEHSKTAVAAEKDYCLKREELAGVVKNLQKSQDALNELLGDKLLREYRAEKENLIRETAYIKTIEKLEIYRNKLEDGSPCPLCGSATHPFAEGHIPIPTHIDTKIAYLTTLITKAEAMEASIKKQEQAETAARENVYGSEKILADADNNKKSAEKTLAELEHYLTTLRTSAVELKKLVAEKLKTVGITELSETNIAATLQSLKLRQQTWQRQEKQMREIEKQITSIDSEVHRVDGVIETQISALTETQEHIDHLKKELADGKAERTQLYGKKKTDEEEQRLHKAIADAEDEEKTARDTHAKLQESLTSAKAHVESLHKHIEQRTPELQKIENDFSAALIQTAFSDEQSFLNACLSHEERAALSFRAQKLDIAETELKAKEKDRKKRLITENEKKLTDKTIDELEPQFKEIEESLKAVRDTIGGIKHRLNENTVAKKKLEKKQIAIDMQKKEYQRWEKLHTLIGSADGKKYRNFAQGLTFELMITHANRQLAKMSDRYLLILDEQQPLELNVVDNYQGGEIRSIKNLSGGESFIVSLTLALGLSKMASRKVRVDSLFLDEGFGTLDEEALETALNTLSGLHQDGKLIGIISHVSALKERISTQITIKPLFGGRSSLSGPGCKKIVLQENNTL